GLDDAGGRADLEAEERVLEGVGLLAATDEAEVAAGGRRALVLALGAGDGDEVFAGDAGGEGLSLRAGGGALLFRVALARTDEDVARPHLLGQVLVAAAVGLVVAGDLGFVLGEVGGD